MWFQRVMTWLTGEKDWWMTDEYQTVYEDLRTIGRKRKPRWFVTPYNFMRRLYFRIRKQPCYSFNIVVYAPKDRTSYPRVRFVDFATPIN